MTMTMTTNIIPTSRPLYIPIKCPVCNGYGSTSYGKNICKACKGEGFLKVPPKDDGEGEINGSR